MKLFRISKKLKVPDTSSTGLASAENDNILNSEILSKIIERVGEKVNLFSGNCGILAIALSKFLKSLGSYNLTYLVYAGNGGGSVEQYFAGEPDVYHVILSVEGGGIDGFFDGHGECDSDQVLSILSEYGLDFSGVDRLNLSSDHPNVETFIRNNTNYDSSSTSDSQLLYLLKEEYEKQIQLDVVKNENI